MPSDCCGRVSCNWVACSFVSTPSQLLVLSGSYPVSLAFHQCIKVIQDSLILPHPEGSSTRRALAWNSVGLSQSTRDFTIELTISRFRPDDIRILRNLFQSVLRGIMAANLDAPLFSALDSLTECIAVGPQINQSAKQEPAAIEISKTLEVVTQILREPTRNLINAMVSGITSVDKVITAMGRFIDLSTDELSLVLDRLRMMMNAFDSADTSLINHPDLPQLYSGQPIVVEIFLFVHPIRQISDQIEAIIMKVMDMQGKNKKWNLNFPSYPWSKSLLRTNAQVRHDRGGLTAGFYFRHKMQLERTMEDLCSKAYVPRLQPQKADSSFATSDGLAYAIGKYEEEKKISLGTNKGSKKTRFRHKLWELIHRLQGFESRFALKVTLVTTLVSVPAWLSQSNSWWNKNEIWWAVVIVWIMMHPRVGGTFQDLAVRSFCAALGSTWAALGYAADNGNPYVMAVFAALFMIPMIYRFTQSSHPRSGIVGCISFTVVSLSAYTNDGQQSIVKIAWTKGLAFVVGVVAAIVVNWVLWPFVARHELRKSLSAMLLHSCLLYRGVVAKYIYYTEGDEPGPQDIERSEMLEGRLREGFVRIRQLLDLTQHEIVNKPFSINPTNTP